MKARVVRWLRRAALGALALVAALTLLPVLTVRFIDPPATMTMIGAAWRRGVGEGEWGWVYREGRSLEALGGHVARAAVASEDGLFWHHHGFDPEAIKDALDANADGGRVRGASTISQQVARNVFLWQGRTWLRKGLEAWYTLWLEVLVPKERILELYLNVAETGPCVFGMEAGAQYWFGRPAAKLSAEQAARLVSILPAPSRWDPRSANQGERAAKILQFRVPFPDDAGFDRAAAQAAPRVGLRALME